MDTNATKAQNTAEGEVVTPSNQSASTKKPITRDRAQVAGVLGIFFGALGVHNFIMRQIGLGIAHIVVLLLFLVGICWSVLFGSVDTLVCIFGIETANCQNILPYLYMFIICVYAPIGCVIWGVIEAIIILVTQKKYPEKQGDHI